MKLNTPLQVSELLFNAAEDILDKERASASAEGAYFPPTTFHLPDCPYPD